MSARRLAVFDLDGTLLDTIGDLAVACDHMLALRSMEGHTYEEYCSFVGNGITRLVERAIPEPLRTAEYIAAARRDFLTYYFDHIDIHSRPYDGVHSLLRRLASEGVVLAVASNKFDAGTKRLVERFFPDVPFAAVYGNREGFPLKPDAALLQMIIGECGGDAEHCWMVGDSGVDIQTARAAGVHSIGVSWGFRSREELIENGADLIVDTADEVYDAIMR